MSKEYGYARISTPKQNIDRQVRNILAAHPQAHIIKEVFTGTKFQGRKDLDKLLRTVKPGDTIIFDSVSRMSRNAEEGFLLYQGLFNQGINLVFLKEPHINTDTYKRALQGGIPATGTNVDFILDGSWHWPRSRLGLHSNRLRKRCRTYTREPQRGSRRPD